MHKPARRWLPLGAMTAVTIGVLAVAVLPVARASHYVREATRLARNVRSGAPAARQVDQAFRKAVVADPLDPTSCIQRAQWSLLTSVDPEWHGRAFEVAANSLGQAVDRDPFNVAHRRMQVQFYQAKARRTRRAGDYLAAIVPARAALELYPTDPAGHASLGDCQLAAGEATGLAAFLLRGAIKSYERALAMDDARPEWERIRGFRNSERRAIDAKIQRAKHLLQEIP